MSFDRERARSIAMPHDAAVRESDPSRGQGPTPSQSLTRLENLMIHVSDAYVVPLSGGVAGAVSGIVSCPLDVIKTKLQAQGGFKRRKGNVSLSTLAYRGVTGTAATIWREEGLRGMYRGLGPMLLGYVPTWAVYLTVYNKGQTFFNARMNNKFLANVYASLTAGACSTMVTNPIWVIKTRLMAQSNSLSPNGHYSPPWHYRNTLDAARKMYKFEGLKSFYSGLTPALLGLTHVAIQFPLYEFFKEEFTGIRAGEIERLEDRSSHFYGLSFSVFLSKIIASTATYPHEVVRTRLQTQQRQMPDNSAEHVSYRGQISKHGDHGRPPGGASSDGMINSLRYRGTLHTCRAILLDEGWRGFYAGLGTNLIRAVPSAMTTILTFEYVKRAILKNQQSANGKLELQVV